MIVGVFEILCGIGALLLLIYYYIITPASSFWEKKGVKGPKPELIYGTFKDVLIGKRSIGEYLKDIYETYSNEKLVGLFWRNSPTLLVKDPDLINDVLIKDFYTTFSERHRGIYEKAEPLSQHLINFDLEKWRPLRKKLTPAFSPAKIKDMFHIFVKCGEHLNKYLELVVTKNEPIEVRDLSVKYTIDVTGSCIFGLQINALSDEENEFCQMSKRIFRRNRWKIIKNKIREYIPWLYNFLGVIFHDANLTNFFVNCVKQSIQYRNENNIKCHDFIDILRDLKNEALETGDVEMTDVVIAAQAYVFFVGGSETSSAAMSNVLYELAVNQEIQDKVRAEIVEQLEEHDGALTIEMVNSLTYLDKVLQGTNKNL